MVNVRLYETVITYKALMLPAKFLGYLFRMKITIYQCNLYAFFNLFFDMLIRAKFDRFHAVFRCTMISVIEWTFKLPFNHKLFAFTFDHESLNTLPTGSFITTNKIDWLFIFKIERKFAQRASKKSWFERLHNQY